MKLITTTTTTNITSFRHRSSSSISSSTTTPYDHNKKKNQKRYYNNNNNYYYYTVFQGSSYSILLQNIIVSLIVVGILGVVLLTIIRFRHYTTQPYNNDNHNYNHNNNNTIMTIQYVMIEEVIGTTNNNNNNNNVNVRSYRKYVAILSHDNLPVDDYRTTTATEITDTTTFVTVSQWVQMIMTSPNDDTSNNNSNTAIQLLNELIVTSPYPALFFETPPISSLPTYKTQRFEFVLVNAPELHEMTIHHHHHYNNNNKAQHNIDCINPFQKPLLSSLRRNPYVASFPNLGGDAILIVPQCIPTTTTTTITTNDDDDNGNKSTGNMIEYTAITTRYAHLANFVRYHSLLESSKYYRDQVATAAVWKMVAQTYHEQIILHCSTIETITSSSSSNVNVISEHSTPPQQPQRDSDHIGSGVWLSTSGMGVLYLHFRIDTTPKYYSYEPYKNGSGVL